MVLVFDPDKIRLSFFAACASQFGQIQLPFALIPRQWLGHGINVDANILAVKP
jgi:hypothetical protein